ncbi:RnfABCDGE type electron transport complex subunit D [Silvimonas sp.]|uniref:RnfABCDGE type electron transport complex subunit D n=1 Tax=Silvimonas sp. TaxID=2650811 RepID=UPI00283B02E3|nr:RnfABCDGE type electron transport complex subunit D [Silvimonas sp.]MDR3427311.1 RnfABCDGE type electron transport complex subunit D [Silvimonas sp.]
MNTSPFFIKPTPLQVVMFKVAAALVPAIVVYTWSFGIGILVQIALATATALATEAFCLKLRGYPIKPFVTDGSAIVTAWLMALSFPPLAPWWMIVVAAALSISLAKHMYGGLGQNTFNPAMVGFAIMIVSFPAQMSRWAAPLGVAPQSMDWSAQLSWIFSGQLPAGLTFDAVASATPLDTVKTQLMQHASMSNIFHEPLFGMIGGVGTEWITAAYLLGGLYLLWQKLIPWQIPVTFLAVLGGMAGIFHLVDPAHYTSPMFHWFSGAAMLGAFFIVTDPVTGPTTPLGRVIFAALIGLLTYLIRVFGGYPDGVAFAVLIMNLAAPFIDQYTQPAVFGRKGKQKNAGAKS